MEKRKTGHLSEKKSTKQLILDAAFSFYRRPWVQEFSMSQLAAEVGISKTAIYRHFKNKEAVFEGMKEYFFDILFNQLREIQTRHHDESDYIKRSEDLIVFFASNSQYINYIITQDSQIKDFEKSLYEELFKRGFTSDFNKVLEKKGVNLDSKKYVYIYFYSVSLIYFIKLREKLLGAKNADSAEGDKLDSKKSSTLGKFSEKLVDFLNRGLSDIVSAKFPVETISKTRLCELDAICKIKENDLPEENRIFTAFANVIRKSGFNSITIENIANELNMAKSSLYFYFENKQKMLFTLISKELSFLEMACVENRAEAKTYSEFIYINMRTALSYFCARPSIFFLCGYLIQSGANKDFGNDECIVESSSNWEVRLKDVFSRFDLGFPVCPEYFTIWTGILTVGLVVLKLKHGLSEEETNEALKYIFDLAMYGV